MPTNSVFHEAPILLNDETFHKERQGKNYRHFQRKQK